MDVSTRYDVRTSMAFACRLDWVFSQTVMDSFGLVCRASFVSHLSVKVSAFLLCSILGASDGCRSSDFLQLYTEWIL